VQRTAEACFMPLTVGGGVRTVDDIRALLLAGADKVSINTAAVKNRDFVKEGAEKFGDQCIVVAIDAKSAGPGRWEIFTHGGRRAGPRVARRRRPPRRVRPRRPGRRPRTTARAHRGGTGPCGRAQESGRSPYATGSQRSHRLRS